VAPEDVDAVVETLRSGWLTMGPRTAEFEEAFAAHLGCRHAVALSSCTAALHLAYLGLGIGPGDEVIVPSYTFAATASAVLYCGGTPVFADVVGPHDLSLDPEDVAARITPRTKAVACVHFAGYAAPVQELRALCDEHGLALVEDAAHAPSAEAGGRKLGTWGAAGCFSFFSNKVLPSGEGGLLATDDDDLAARVRSLRSHAMTSVTWDRHRGHAETYDIVDIGFNYRLDEPRAALLLSQMRRLGDEVAARRRLTRRYRELLSGVAGLTVPYEDEAVERSSCYIMPVLVEDAERRDAVRLALRERHGVQTSLLYPAVHRFTAYRSRYPDVSLPRTEDASAREVTLPLFRHLGDDGVDRVVDALSRELGG
jgi:dTDP-4-amino-4,6-dideoxygalactose transaminase